MVSAKSLVILGLGLLSGVQACVEISGYVSDGFDTTFAVDITDDGTKTCSFSCSAITNTCDADCNDGYSASADTGTEFTRGGDLTVSYSTPHGDYKVGVPQAESGCTNCCGGNIPCVCCQNDYSGSFFGC